QIYLRNNIGINSDSFFRHKIIYDIRILIMMVKNNNNNHKPPEKITQK
ncbi:4074_t:CDS:1, partial [Entrophospora sp. SA101]